MRGEQGGGCVTEQLPCPTKSPKLAAKVIFIVLRTEIVLKGHSEPKGRPTEFLYVKRRQKIMRTRTEILILLLLFIVNPVLYATHFPRQKHGTPSPTMNYRPALACQHKVTRIVKQSHVHMQLRRGDGFPECSRTELDLNRNRAGRVGSDRVERRGVGTRRDETSHYRSDLPRKASREEFFVMTPATAEAN